MSNSINSVRFYLQSKLPEKSVWYLGDTKLVTDYALLNSALPTLKETYQEILVEKEWDSYYLIGVQNYFDSLKNICILTDDMTVVIADFELMYPLVPVNSSVDQFIDSYFVIQNYFQHNLINLDALKDAIFNIDSAVYCDNCYWYELLNHIEYIAGQS